MWHWVQRVSRERLDQRSLPTRHREQIAGIEAEGFDAHLVNLTLDIRPVILSVLLGRGWIITSAASASDPERAMAKSLAEGIAAAGIVSNAEPRTEPISAEEVRMPEHHIRLHRDASLIDRDRFLFSSPDTIRLDEIASPPESVADAVSTAGEPLTVELGSPATAPFHVVRALVPGIVPISFGFDQEPLGMPRLAEPKTTRDGRRLGRRLELEETGPLLPHPFA